ncbi:MAG: NAD(P)/FAD-dependent oxidoreductase [Cellvibrio sp.]|uniref:NAD(P)/FAD-dependent oxidoreductase n=1 Tax=Cellvibrio sp. TaxID=1965322 RepID=UPI002715C2C4|nr:NAD(P)/FAD-dependent oxidoreductase [Cellvibrio sp.]
MALPSQTQVLIIGAGAAGLMCAATAGARGRAVVVIDHANKVGKKILMSGGGRCNFTNMDVLPKSYLSDNGHFCKSALARYTQWDFIALVQKHRIPYHEKKLGQLFCDNKAQDILSMLLDECAQAGADIYTLCDIEQVTALTENDLPMRYKVKTSQGTIYCESLVVATGGLSIPTMGATGVGYELAGQFGLPLKPRTAGLVPFTLSPAQLAVFSPCVGNALDVSVSCETTNGHVSFAEAMLFTHRGFSGPAMLQISSYWQPGKELEINLLPQLNLFGFLSEQQKARPKVLLTTIVGELLTKNIAQCLCDYWGAQWNGNRPINQYTPAELQLVATQFHEWKIMPAGTEGYRTAEVTLGGVDTNHLSSKTMEAKAQAGLFFIGEVVDVTGHLGGFNFQWAWASGVAAAAYV